MAETQGACLRLQAERYGGKIPEYPRQRVQAYSAVWEKLIEDAAKAGRLRISDNLPATKLIIDGAMNWVATLPKVGRPPQKELIPIAIDIILNGLLKPEET